jgi:WD40 repeat protein
VKGNLNRVVEDFAQVSENKLAVMFRKKFCIYSMADGSLLMSKEKYNFHSLHCVENRYALVYFSVGVYEKKEHKLLVVDLNDLSTKEMKIDGKVLTSAYLEDGLLVLGGQSISIWNTNRWPFELIKSKRTIQKPVHAIAALSGDVFASAFDCSVWIQDSDLKLLHKIKLENDICELKSLGNDVLLINKSLSNWRSEDDNVLLYNFRSGKFLKRIRIMYPTKSLLLTPDKEFLVLAGLRKVLIYHLNAGYVYSEYETPQRYQFQINRVEQLNNCKFGGHLNSVRSELFIFDFEN